MAIAGGAKPSILMEIKDGVLHVGSVEQRQGVVNDVDTAVHRLLSGEVVFVQTFGSLVERVQKTVEATLKPRGEGGHRG